MKPPNTTTLLAVGMNRAMKKAEALRTHREAQLDREAALLFDAFLTQIRANNIVFTQNNKCTLTVIANTSLNGQYDYENEIQHRMTIHFAAENVQLMALTITDVSFGADHRNLSADDVNAIAGISCLCCCLPALFYYLPMCIYQFNATRFSNRYTATVCIDVDEATKLRSEDPMPCASVTATTTLSMNTRV